MVWRGRKGREFHKKGVIDMVFEWKPGSRVKADAQAAGEMCDRLEKKGMLTARNLVAENRPEDAPLHGCFEWVDSVAAENWREHQARHIINSIVVRSEKKEPVRVFFKIETEGNRYESVETIVSSGKSEELLQMALKELECVRRKYESISELISVWREIGRLYASFYK